MKKVNFKRKIDQVVKLAKVSKAKLDAVNYALPTDKDQFKLLAAYYGLKNEDYNKEFDFYGRLYTILEIKEHHSSRPIMVKTRYGNVKHMLEFHVQRALGNKDFFEVCSGVSLAKHRVLLEDTLIFLQGKQKEISEGRELIRPEIPTIDPEDYVNKEWSVIENIDAIHGFRYRAGSIIAQWSTAERKVINMSKRRIVAFLMVAYQVPKNRAIRIVEAAFINQDFLTSLRKAENAVAKIIL